MNETTEIRLDIRGQICPSCLLLTLKEVNGNHQAIRSGAAEVVVFTDDRQAVTTIPEATAKMGYLSEVAREDEAYRIRIFTRDTHG